MCENLSFGVPSSPVLAWGLALQELPAARSRFRAVHFPTVFGAAPACTSALLAFYFWTRREEIEQAPNKELVLESRPWRRYARAS